MKKINFATATKIFLLMLICSISIDIVLNEIATFSHTDMSYLTSRAVGLTLGTILYYLCIVYSLKANFFGLMTETIYNKNTAMYWKYRAIPVVVISVQTLLGHISYISIPLMLLVSVELTYLFILNKHSNKVSTTH